VQNVLILARDSPEHPPLQVARALVAAGYDICPTALDDGVDDLVAAFRGKPPTLLVADLSDGADMLVIRRARALLTEVWGEGMPTPPCLALLTRRHLVQPEMRAFVDDFLLPPYDPEEVKARVALMVFKRRHVEPGDVLAFGGIRLSLAAGQVYDENDRPLPLTPREYDLLRFMLTHRGRGFSREQLLALVWGVDYDGGERTVDIHIRRLRAKLPEQTANLLETRRGLGYGFRAE
jgi:DNA-binding response OmpR family regulator